MENRLSLYHEVMSQSCFKIAVLHMSPLSASLVLSGFSISNRWLSPCHRAPHWPRGIPGADAGILGPSQALSNFMHDLNSSVTFLPWHADSGHRQTTYISAPLRAKASHVHAQVLAPKEISTDLAVVCFLRSQQIQVLWNQTVSISSTHSQQQKSGRRAEKSLIKLMNLLVIWRT